MAGSFRGAGLFFAPRRRAGKFPRDVDKLLYSPANFLKIALDARAAVAQNLSRSPLVPIDAPGLNYLVQYPAFCARFRFA
jgi:hypothetical protein